MKRFIAGLAVALALAATLLFVLALSPFSYRSGIFLVHAQQQSYPGGTGTGLSGILASVACGANPNCVTWTENDSTNNCGAATTAWLAAVNAYAGTGVAQAQIYSGGGKAFKFSSCGLAFTNARGVTIQLSATIDCAQSTQACIQLGATNTSGGAVSYSTNPQVYRIYGGGGLIGGASLTGSGGNGSGEGGGIYVMPQVTSAYIEDLFFGFFGANNATLGNCSNYAIYFDNPVAAGYVHHVYLASSSSGVTAGACGIGNPGGASLGSNTVMISDNTVGTQGEAGGTGQCGSIGINDGGTLGTQSNNNVFGYGIPILLQGIGHKIIGNQLDSTQCAAGGVSADIQVGGTGTVGPVSITSNVAQIASGHAGNLMAIANGATPTLANWTITNNLNNLLTNASIFAGTFPSCGRLVSTDRFCFVGGNQNMTGPTGCGSTTTGWEYGTVVGGCAPGGLTANETTQTLFTSGGGAYYITCQVVLTTAAGTSSTLPNCNIQYTDGFTSVSTSTVLTPAWASGTVNCTGSVTNTVGNSCQGGILVTPLSGTAVTFTTTNYASNAAATMQYQMLVVAQSVNQ